LKGPRGARGSERTDLGGLKKKLKKKKGRQYQISPGIPETELDRRKKPKKPRMRGWKKAEEGGPSERFLKEKNEVGGTRRKGTLGGEGKCGGDPGETEIKERRRQKNQRKGNIQKGGVAWQGDERGSNTEGGIECLPRTLGKKHVVVVKAAPKSKERLKVWENPGWAHFGLGGLV